MTGIDESSPSVLVYCGSFARRHTQHRSVERVDSLARLRAGVRVSIDDFGTGNTSLAYFKDIPADELKIDKSFVMAMAEGAANRRLVKTIIDLAHGFGLSVVGEGVETDECVDRLRELGCDLLQGFRFSKALRQEDFLRYLERAL